MSDSKPVLHVELAKKMVEFVREDVDLVMDDECEVLVVRFSEFLKGLVDDVELAFEKGYDVGYLEGLKSLGK